LIFSGAFGRNTRGKTEKVREAAERLDVASIAARAPSPHMTRGAWSTFEAVIESHDDFLLVRKTGDAAALADDLDARR
jgi:hypothetical protein